MGEKGQIIGGKFGEIIIRQKSDADLEIGELLINEYNNSKNLLQVHEIFYGSQISAQNLEKVAGMNLENSSKTTIFDSNLRNYKLAKLKALISIDSTDSAKSTKNLPEFFGTVREVNNLDLKFLSDSKNKLYLGNLRSGTKKLDLPVYLDGEKVFSHHILITGTTGRGKSVLMKNLIWSATQKDFAAMLVFDPHDEYYGRKTLGLKDYPDKEKIVYYTTKDVPVGQRSLKMNLSLLRPDHFDFLNLTSPQRQIMYVYFKKFRKEWIKNILINDEVEMNSNEINEMSLAVLKRRLKLLLDLDADKEQIYCKGLFDEVAGKTILTDITKQLEDGKTVIVDTSTFSGNIELLIASILTTEIFNKYKQYNNVGTLISKPVVNIVLEEAPRVIGKDVLEQGSNVFSTIAREGRKFKVGLSAITQLPSLIPKEILANLNTKIIMGTEMNSERLTIIESASQDLSTDNRNIAALDKGEAIITSNFARFALPISIPFFDDRIKEEQENNKTKEAQKINSFSGINLK